MTRYQYRTLDLEAIGITLPDIEGEHPNRVPFAGVLTLVDVPSDRPPNGAQGHRVEIPRAVAEKALPTLIGMAVDVAGGLTDHNAKRKIGIITQAAIQGQELGVSGYLFAKDFPEEVMRVQQMKDELGMSYEITDVDVEDAAAQIWRLSNLVFTGGAILRKDAAAYRQTSLQARHDGGDEEEAFMAVKTDLTNKLSSLLDKLNVAAEGEEEKKLDETEEQKAAKLKAEDDKKKEDEMARNADAEAARLKAQDSEHEDEEQDKDMIRRLMEDVDAPEEEEALMRAVQRMFRGKRGRMAQAGTGQKDSAATKALQAQMGDMQAAMGLLTDAVTKIGGLLTDYIAHDKGLKTDKAATDADGGLKAKANGDGDKLNVQRKTFHAGEEQFYLAKYGIEEDSKYTVPQIDKILKDNGVTNPETRIGIKHSMEARGMFRN